MFKYKFLTLLGALTIATGGQGASPELLQEVKMTTDEPPLQKKLEEIDVWLSKAVETLRIPGAAVGIVVDGKTVFAKGYGERGEFKGPVTENTLFAIGSCSKAFTTFALGQLVDEGTIGWDDPVIKHIPEFRLHDLHATHHLTVRDLVTHRSGLPRHDLVWYNSKFPRAEILNRLPHLEPTSDLREKFQYNNLMYAVAGLLVERVTGKTWEEYVQEQIFDRLGMDRSNFSVERSQMSSDFALPHTEKEGRAESIPFRHLGNIGPAGSINSSVHEMAKWMTLHLSQGEVEGKRLIRKESLEEMHRVQMACPDVYFPDFPTFFGYGLGWAIGLYEGRYVVAHGGGIDGFISHVALFPKEKIGIVILTNSDKHGLFPAGATYAIADALMGTGDGKWLVRIEEKEKQMKTLLEKPGQEESVARDAATARPLDRYIGEYEHPGYGTVAISVAQDALCATYNEMPFLLEHQCYDHFVGSASGSVIPKFNCSFVGNPSGEIAELHIALESSLPPLSFKKKASSELLAADYLKKFEGKFECSLFSLDITYKKGRLTATAAGQPTCELKPEKRNLFSFKELADCSLEFILDKEGSVSELQLRQAGQTLNLKAAAKDLN